MRGRKPIAELAPGAKGKPLRELPDLLASLPHLSEEEAFSFEQDLAAARAELNRVSALCVEPWPS